MGCDSWRSGYGWLHDALMGPRTVKAPQGWSQVPASSLSLTLDTLGLRPPCGQPPCHSRTGADQIDTAIPGMAMGQLAHPGYELSRWLRALAGTGALWITGLDL